MQTTPSSVSRKRKYILLAVWCALIAADVAGLIWNGVRLSQGTIGEAKFQKAALHFAISLATISAVFLAEALFRFRVSLPLAVCCCVFAFCANTVSNVFCMYDYFRYWDKVLHSLSGVLFAVIGMGLALLLLRDMKEGRRKVAAVVLIGFLIALAEGYLWEMFEFTVDSVDPSSNTQAWMDGMVQMGSGGEYDIPDGMYLISERRGGALMDTMTDLILNFAGALIVLVPCFIVFCRDADKMKAFAFTAAPRRKKTEKTQET